MTPEKFTELMDKITQCHSLTVISHWIDAEVDNITEKQALVFKAMNDAFPSLDEIYIVAYDQLGNTDKANVLREWMKNKAKRDKDNRANQV